MHNGLELRFVFDFERNDVAVGALGDDGFLNHRLITRIAQDLFQPAHEAAVRIADFLTDLRQFDRGGVEHLTLIRDGAADGFNQSLRRNQTARHGGELRVFVSVVFQGTSEIPADGKHVGKAMNLFPAQCAGLSRQCQQRRGIKTAAEADAVVHAEQPPRFRHQREFVTDDRRIRVRFQFPCAFLGQAEIGKGSQFADDLRVLKHRKGFFIHHVRFPRSWSRDRSR